MTEEIVKRGRGRPRKYPVGFKPVYKSKAVEKLEKQAEAEARVALETDEEIDVRLRERFSVMQEVVHAATEKNIRSLVLSGPPGLGKSYITDHVLDEYDPEHEYTTKVKGFSRATGLLRTLYDYRHEHNITVFDDCDSIFYDDVCLNLLKAALDSNKKRSISWLSERELEDENGMSIPRTFEFEGTIIFITNLDFYSMIAKGHKLAPHLEALTSRATYLSLDIHTKREYMVRIRQVMNETNIMKDNGYNPSIKDDVLNFIETNCGVMRDLSLRACLKVAALRSSNPTSWDRLARVILCK